MKREILMSLEANEKRVAVLEEGKLDEYYIERAQGQRMFGNIYKGVVKTVIPGIGAAFVDLGTQKDGFLYVADALKSPMNLDAEFEEEKSEKPQPRNRDRGRDRGRHHRDKRKKIEEVLKIGQEVIVQIVKEPIRNKGPRLTTHFSIPARYLVMMPGDQKVGVSRRIGDRKERERIRNLFKTLDIPQGVGFIVRTAGEGKSEKEFNRDIRYLIRLWKKIHASISRKKPKSLIYSELDLVERIIRDHMQDETDKIIVDHKDLQRKVQRFLQLYLPGKKGNIVFYNHKVPLFEKYGVEKEIEKTIQKTVFLKSGGHIVIEQTEGLVAIDVNTGKFTGKTNLEDTVYRTNIEAAEEVSRQMRLRDLGGIIIIDFIDMERYENRRSLFRRFKEFVSRDRAKTNILQVSELGLIEMTRQRIRPSLESAVYNTCSYCTGTGLVKSETTMSIQALREIKKAIGHSQGRTVNAFVHPSVSERILHYEKKTLKQLERRNHMQIHIFPDVALHAEDVNITFVK